MCEIPSPEYHDTLGINFVDRVELGEGFDDGAEDGTLVPFK